jgi:hypothetical protein
MRKKDLKKFILAPEVRQFQDLQVIDFKGKDARGFDFAVQLAPVAAIAHLRILSKVKADRVNMYLGGDPNDIKNIDTEIEIYMADEIYKIDSAAMTYIPKGTAHQHRVVKKPAKNSWVLSLTLPPKYIEPGKKGK